MMELFPVDPALNLLPRDGMVLYRGPMFEPAESSRLFCSLLEEVPWRKDELVLFGKRLVMDRQVAWFGDEEFDYRYSGTTKRAVRWSLSMARLRAAVEGWTGARFNSCLANLYHSGGEGMAWHSDDERTLVRHAPIASLSFGAERRFRFRHRATRESVEVLLQDGSLLEMKGETQTHWQHCLPKTKKVAAPRINLTFRLMETVSS